MLLLEEAKHGEVPTARGAQVVGGTMVRQELQAMPTDQRLIARRYTHGNPAASVLSSTRLCPPHPGPPLQLIVTTSTAVGRYPTRGHVGVVGGHTLSHIVTHGAAQQIRPNKQTQNRIAERIPVPCSVEEQIVARNDDDVIIVECLPTRPVERPKYLPFFHWQPHNLMFTLEVCQFIRTTKWLQMMRLMVWIVNMCNPVSDCCITGNFNINKPTRAKLHNRFFF